MRSYLPLFVSTIFFTQFCFADNIIETSKLVVVREHLLGIEPEWKPHVLKSHVTGQPYEVEYFGEDENEEPVLSKKILYYETGMKQEESDFGIEGAEKGLLHGLSVKWYDNGVEQEIANYKNGLLHGLRVSFYTDGTLRSKETFEEGQSVGLAEEFYSDNTKKCELHYTNGKIEGEKWEYFPNGKRKSLTSYKEGKKEGYSFEWFENGVVAVKIFYENDLCTNDGKNPGRIEYDEYHALKEIAETKAGKLHGVMIAYYPSGQEKVKGNYLDGLKHGSWTHYFENGGVLGEEHFDHNIAVKKHWMKHENGKTHWSAEFDEKGTTLQPVKVYTPEGTLIKQFSMKEGKYHGKYFDWYPSGVLKLDGKQEMGFLDGEVLQYFENGMPWIFSNYKKGKLQGKLQRWHENGNVAFKAEYVDGVFNGEVIEWYPNGEICRKEYYNEGEPNGLFQFYNEQNILLQSSTYENGKLVGTAKEYDPKGYLIFEASYKEGKFHGTITSYFSEERLNYVYEYRDGHKSGKSIEYWPNGKLKFQAFYENNKQEGVVQAWFENGAPHFVRFYKEGVTVGEQKFYFPRESNEDEVEPVLSKVINYDSTGRLHKEQKTFFPDGKSASLVTYENGELQGLKAIWNENGDLIQECWYENGKLEGKFYMRDPVGNEIVCYYERNKKHGPFERFYPEQPRFGKVKALEATYYRGYIDGEVIEYNEAGLKISSCNFEKGKKEGPAYVFDTRGLLVSKMQFVNNKKEGEALQYFPNGRIYKVTPFVNDQIEGEQISYFVDGKIASSIFYTKNVVNGLSRSWNENGVLVFEGVYVMGKKEGKFNKYYDNGHPRLLQEYKEDKIISKKSFDPDGNELA